MPVLDCTQPKSSLLGLVFVDACALPFLYAIYSLCHKRVPFPSSMPMCLCPGRNIFLNLPSYDTIFVLSDYVDAHAFMFAFTFQVTYAMLADSLGLRYI